MSRTYVVVADASCARIYTSVGHRQLSLLEQLDHPEGRMHPSELVSDRQGSSRNDASSAPHAFEPHTSVRDAERERFAQAIAHYVDAACASGAMHDVILVMLPRLLGEVRAALSSRSTARISLSIAERFLDLDERDLVSRIEAAGGLRPTI